jgi:hypothetical protein
MTPPNTPFVLNDICGFIGKEVLNALGVLENCYALEQSLESIEAAAVVIADVFGDGAKFKGLLGKELPERREKEKKLLAGFQNNLNLLIEKTWIEKADEALKEQVLYRLKLYCSRLADRRYLDSQHDFMEVLNDTVYLLFGAQSKKPDFAEYAMRIDPEFGIFWQYIRILSTHTQTALLPEQGEKCRVLLLLGMFFLENY